MLSQYVVDKQLLNHLPTILSDSVYNATDNSSDLQHSIENWYTFLQLQLNLKKCHVFPTRAKSNSNNLIAFNSL